MNLYKNILRWMVRGVSLLTLLFILFIIVAHFNYGDIPDLSVMTNVEFWLAVCLLTILFGLVLTFKWSGVGGVVVVLSCISFGIIENKLWIGGFLFFVFVVGLLNVLLFWIDKRTRL